METSNIKEYAEKKRKSCRREALVSVFYVSEYVFLYGIIDIDALSVYDALYKNYSFISFSQTTMPGMHNNNSSE